MNQDNKSRNIFTLIVVVLFLIFSYYLIKSFFEEKTPDNTYTPGSFSFVFNTNEIDDKLMYDENRTVKVVKNSNYTDATGDIKSKLFLKSSKIDYYFDSIKISIDNKDYIDVYRIDKDSIRLVILGTDLNYYKIDLYIGINTDEMDINDKSWKDLGKNIACIYPCQYYKVINDKYSIFIEFPKVINEEKYPKEEYNKLVNKIKKIVRIEEINNESYYVLYNSDIKLNDNVTLLLKDKKIDTYYSKMNSDYSLTYLSYYNQNNELININEIDNIDNYLKTVNVVGEFNYKDYNVKSLDNNSIIIEIDNKYYLINNNRNISDLNTYLDGILEIE
ncbi:MAG: hypothetical protein IKZ96_03145 [Bacilli bacterium]|nr:hypothetical protein [Bacilli bacterium]